MKPEMYWIPCPQPGRLAIMPRPRGGDWLHDEIRGWKEAGLNTIMCMLTSEEITELDLADEASLCEELGFAFIPFPVPDRGIPSSRAPAEQLLNQLAKQIESGQNVGIHC